MTLQRPLLNMLLPLLCLGKQQSSVNHTPLSLRWRLITTKIAAQILADDLDVILRRKASGLRLVSNEQMRGLIDDTMKNNLRENSQSFLGGKLIDSIV